MGDKHKIGDLVVGYHSGLGIVTDIQFKTTTDGEKVLMYLVQHFKTREECWHISIGIDKMKAMYEKVIIQGKFENLFDIG